MPAGTFYSDGIKALRRTGETKRDGVMAKVADGTYQPNKRAQIKVKHLRTADVVVAGFREHKNGDGPGSLMLGIYDEEGRLHHLGVAGHRPERPVGRFEPHDGSRGPQLVEDGVRVARPERRVGEVRGRRT